MTLAALAALLTVGCTDADRPTKKVLLIGLDGVRVVDASIMPEITNGNLNAVVIMMAEKIADGMKQTAARSGA